MERSSTTVQSSPQQGTGPDGMDLEETRRIIREYIHALLNGADFGQYLAENVALVIVDTGDRMEGREVVVQAITDWHTVAFDARPEVVSSVVDEGKASVELIFNGVHTGDFAGMPGSGTEVSVPYVAVYDLENRSIREIRLYGILSGLLAQLSPKTTG